MMKSNMITVPINFSQHPGTLLDQVRWLYDNRPQHTAVVLVGQDGEESVTYHEFFSQAARYAYALEQAGIQQGDLVALILQHGEDVLFAFWGALLLGAVPSIFPFLTEKLDRKRYFDSVRKLIAHSTVRVAITYSDLEDDLRACLRGVQTLRGIINANQLSAGGTVEEYLARNPAKPDDTAFLQHSSGSTGLQKGVMLSHRSVMNQIASYSEALYMQPDDVIVSWLPLYHDMGLIAGFIMPILQGVKLILMSPFHWIRDPKILLNAIDRHNGTLCWLPNFAYNFLATRIRDADIEGLNLASLRAVINCSEPVYAESHQLFAERFKPYGFREEALTTCYAMAENTFAVTQGGIIAPITLDVVDRQRLMEDRIAIAPNGNSPAQTMVSCGAPIPGCAVRIVDDNRNILPERYVGEIALTSDSMLTGYYKRPEETDAVMQDGWYFTGDMGYVADGELYITGRKKDLIIVGGKNVYPQDIENLLNDVRGIHPGRVVAFGVFNDKLGTEDVAIIAEINAGSDLDADKKSEIVREVRARVAQNTDVTARFVQLVDPMWLIKTSSGKIARNANREKFLSEILS
jgi:acyl-CoA synthetase (AMP-forming)/AMP-acid ligase II